MTEAVFQLAEHLKDNKRLPQRGIVEIKYDGTMALCQHGEFWNRSRKSSNERGRNITYKYPEIHPPTDSVLVGEICHFNEWGVSDFNAILKRNCENRDKIRIRSKTIPCDFVVFDALEVGGQKIDHLPLSERLRILDDFFARLSKAERNEIRVRYADRWDINQLDAVLEIVEEYHAEGVMIKDLSKPYVPKRGTNWLKRKMWKYANFRIQRVDTGDRGGFILIINNKGYEQRVVCNDRKYQQRVQRGAEWVVVKYLEETDSHALRKPSVYSVRDQPNKMFQVKE